MADLLDFEAIKTRIEARLVFKATVHKQGVRQEALRGLHYLFLSGEEMPRGDFKPMLGVSDRDATDALGALVKRGLLNSDSPQGKVRFGPVRSGLVWFGLVWFGLVCRNMRCALCSRRCGQRRRRRRIPPMFDGELGC